MCMPTQIQLNPVQTVKSEPESDVRRNVLLQQCGIVPARDLVIA